MTTVGELKKLLETLGDEVRVEFWDVKTAQQLVPATLRSVQNVRTPSPGLLEFLMNVKQ